jgi:hypothetical protein
LKHIQVRRSLKNAFGSRTRAKGSSGYFGASVKFSDAISLTGESKEKTGVVQPLLHFK